MRYINMGIQFVQSLLSVSTSSDALSRTALNSLFIRIGASVLAFLMNIILARSLGPSEYGLFVYAMGCLNILLIPASLGFDKLLVRQIAVYHSSSEWGKMRGIFDFAISNTLVASISVCLLMSVVVYVVIGSDRMASIFYFAAMLIPFGATIRLSQGILQGLRFVAIGQLPEFIIQPLVLTVLTIAVLNYTKQYLLASQAMLLNVISSGVALYIGIYLLKRSLPLEIRGAQKVANTEKWIPSLVLLMMVGGVFILNDQLTVVLLGFLGTAHEVAVYSAAEKWSRLTIFMLVALNPALAPVFASLYANMQMEKLQRVVVLSAQLVTLFAIIPLLAFIALPHLFLSAFGSNFSAGSIPLILLGAGQFINASTGSVGVLLTMTGYEGTVIWSSVLGIAVNLLLALVLIPNLGATGAAISTSTSIILTNVILSIVVFRKLKIAPTVIGLFLVKHKEILY